MWVRHEAIYRHLFSCLVQVKRSTQTDARIIQYILKIGTKTWFLLSRENTYQYFPLKKKTDYVGKKNSRPAKNSLNGFEIMASVAWRILKHTTNLNASTLLLMSNFWGRTIPKFSTITSPFISL